MKSGLIGYTGFVGGNILAQRNFDRLYNSKNIDDIRGEEFDTLVCSAMPAAKWLANKDSEGDLAIMKGLLSNLKQVKAKTFILISTVDVYPTPFDVCEDSSIDLKKCQPYGRHRLMLEQEVGQYFEKVLIVRLPALFGKGLKKNAVYDLLNDNETHKIHSGIKFQFYNLENIWKDIEKALSLGVKVINFATEPVTISEVAEKAFGIEFKNEPFENPPVYDFRTNVEGFYSSKPGYLYTRDEVFNQLKSFVENYKS